MFPLTEEKKVTHTDSTHQRQENSSENGLIQMLLIYKYLNKY